MPKLEGVAVLCWLLGAAVGERAAVAALHGPRLASLLEAIVDTPVRGVVYEAAGTVDAGVLEEGAALVRRAAATYRMPVELVTAAPDEHDRWLEQAVTAFERALAG